MHGERPPRPVCAQSIIDVIEACWHADPDRRPSFTVGIFLATFFFFFKKKKKFIFNLIISLIFWF